SGTIAPPAESVTTASGTTWPHTSSGTISRTAVAAAHPPPAHGHGQATSHVAPSPSKPAGHTHAAVVPSPTHDASGWQALGLKHLPLSGSHWPGSSQAEAAGQSSGSPTHAPAVHR